MTRSRFDVVAGPSLSDQGFDIAEFQKRVVALGLSVAELARRSGMLKSQVAKIMAGKSPMTRGLEQIVEKLERERR